MPLSIPDLENKIDAELPTNNVGAIDATTLRGVLKAIVDNEQVTAAQILTSSGTPSSTTFLAGDNTWKVPPGTGGGGGGGLSGVSSANFANTKVEAAATTFPAIASGGPSWLTIMGLTAVGDCPAPLVFTRIGATAPASPMPASAYFQSADGDYWLYKAQNGVVWGEHFGAKSNANSGDPTYDAWQGLEDAKYFVILTGGAALAAPLVLRLGPGFFRLSKSHSIEGAPYCFFGNPGGGTMLRTPWNVDAIQVQHSFGGLNTIGHEGGPYTLFPTYLGQIVHNAGRVYKCTTIGSPSGSTFPSGTGTSIIDGTAVWSYVRELTYAEATGVAGAGQFTVIKDFTIFGLWDRHNSAQDDEDQTVPDGAYHSGIVLRGRATVENIFALAYPGLGVVSAADGHPLIRGAGNANGWSFRRVRGYYCGFHGVSAGYSDGNAGIALDIDTAYNGGFGVYDYGFLTNTWISCQDAYSGAQFNGLVKYKGLVNHNGYYYVARVPATGSEGTPNYDNEPGTDLAAWFRVTGDGSTGRSFITGSISGTTLTATTVTGAALLASPIYGSIIRGTATANTRITAQLTGTPGGAGTYTVSISQTTTLTTATTDTGNPDAPPWNTLEHYRPCGAFASDNVNNRATWIGPYIEGGTNPAQWSLPTTVLSGITGESYNHTTGMQFLQDGSWRNQIKAQAAPVTDAGPKTFGIALGPKTFREGVNADSNILSWTDFESNTYALAGVAASGDQTANLDFKWSGFLQFLGITTQHLYGRATAAENVFGTYINKLIVGDRTFNDGMGVWCSPTIPTVSGHNGEFVFNTNRTASGDPLGWSCRGGTTWDPK